MFSDVCFFDLLYEGSNTSGVTFELNFLVIDQEIDVKAIEEIECFYHFVMISRRLHLSDDTFVDGIGGGFSMCFECSDGKMCFIWKGGSG